MGNFQKLVYARLQALPKGCIISVGSSSFTKEEALKHVSENDRIGKLFIAADRHYFDAIKSGELYASIAN